MKNSIPVSLKNIALGYHFKLNIVNIISEMQSLRFGEKEETRIIIHMQLIDLNKIKIINALKILLTKNCKYYRIIIRRAQISYILKLKRNSLRSVCSFKLCFKHVNPHLSLYMITASVIFYLGVFVMQFVFSCQNNFGLKNTIANSYMIRIFSEEILF